MNPRRGENPPFNSSSRSQSCLGVRSQDGHSRDSACNSDARSAETIRLTSSPPCGGFKRSGERFVPCSPTVVIIIYFTYHPFLSMRKRPGNFMRKDYQGVCNGCSGEYSWQLEQIPDFASRLLQCVDKTVSLCPVAGNH